MEKLVAGIDASKKVVDVHVKGENRTFANGPQGNRVVAQMAPRSRRRAGGHGGDRAAAPVPA